MNNSLHRLEEYGVNLTEVMSRFVNDEQLYLDCINYFVIDPDFVRLKSAINNKDYELAFNYAHTLKGVSANLGLKPLYVVICRIVEPLRNNEYQDLEQLYENVLAEKEIIQRIL